MVAIIKNKAYGSDSSFSHISVQHDEIYLWLNFRFNLLSRVGIIALFRCLIVTFHVISFNNLLL